MLFSSYIQSTIEQCEIDKKHSIARSCVVLIQITGRVPPSNLRAHLHKYYSIIPSVILILLESHHVCFMTCICEIFFKIKNVIISVVLTS